MYIYLKEIRDIIINISKDNEEYARFRKMKKKYQQLAGS